MSSKTDGVVDICPVARDPADSTDNGNQTKLVQGSERWASAIAADAPRLLSWNIMLTFVMCIPAFLCGSMAGYDSSVMAGFLVMGSFQDLFGANVNGFQAGYITSIYQIAGVVAIPFIGPCMDRFGRRSALFLGCLASVLGAIIQATSARTGSLGQFLAGRFMLGFGGVLAQAAAPTYCVEVAHPAHRGILAGGQSSMQNFGGIIAAAVTLGTVNLRGDDSWIIPTWVQLACPGIACLMIWFLPESPRWLYTHNRQTQALEFITKYHGNGNIENPWVKLQLLEFEEQLEQNNTEKWWDYRPLFTTRAKRYRLGNSLLIGVWGALSSGGISYYVGAFYASAGITDPTTVLLYTLWQNVTSTLASFIGSPLCDLLGRRRLFLPTLLGMALSWAAVAVGAGIVDSDPSNVAAAKAGIAFYFIFSFIYCIGITPLQGVYAAEVFAYEQRAKGVAFQNLGVNIAGLVNQFGTPVALERIGYKTYIIWSVWNLIEFGISYFWSVETKGFTLEELDEIFESPNPRKASTRKRAVRTSTDVSTHLHHAKTKDV